MGFLTRLATLARADAHGVVDALEDKALMLRQHVREAAAEVDRKRCRLEASAAEDKDLRSQAERIREQAAALDEDVRMALAGDKEELARYAIAKLLPLRHGAARIEHRLEELAGERSELEPQLAEQQAELERLEQRVRGYLARQGEDGGVAAFLDLVVTDEDVELELLRRRRGPEEGAA